MTFIPALAKRAPSSEAACTYSLSVRLLEEAKTHTVHEFPPIEAGCLFC